MFGDTRLSKLALTAETFGHTAKRNIRSGFLLETPLNRSSRQGERSQSETISGTPLPASGIGPTAGFGRETAGRHAVSVTKGTDPKHEYLTVDCLLVPKSKHEAYGKLQIVLP